MIKKSQMINSLINDKHNTFFHRNCPGSSRTRVLMDGVVEIAWFCPSGRDDDKFTDRVAFCNLHGDAGEHEKQMHIMTKMSSVNIVVLPQLSRDDKRMTKIQNLYKDPKPLICLLPEDDLALTEMGNRKYKIGLKGRGQADVSEDLRRAITNCLPSASTFRLEDVSKHSDIRVDEEDDDDDCKKGKEAAQQMISLLEKKDLTEIKESFLPHQGKLWHQWCEKNKELNRPQGDDPDMEISKKKVEMKKIREQQHKAPISEFINLFIKQMNLHAENKSTTKPMFFLKWLRILLDEYTSADLSGLHHKYDKTWAEVSKLSKSSSSNKSKELLPKQKELVDLSKKLQDATFGLEHIMREIGQIYESCSSVKKNKKDLQFDFSSLPSLAAEMMISGFPLELMDGDAAHVPVIWISAVLDQLIQKLGDQRIFVLSVLGIQSSGKSTMLNAMFGLQFAVSAGRCTRGAFMQLVRVSDEIKTQMNIDYILVVDTEGLRALELAGTSTRHHDNELATFVIGLGNLTLVNIFGENPSEMQDILQIVVQAFMRMKEVRLTPSCVFVHQNVSDVTAREKNMDGRRRLQEKLDEMTKLAAEDEVSDAECFSDVIAFDVQNDVVYFAQLWEGSPPMAPSNPSYCENIQDLKTTILSHLQNALEIAAYRKLETEYGKWTWSLRKAMLEIENKLQNQIENAAINEVEETDLQGKLNENIIRETQRKLNVVLQQRVLKKKIDAQRTQNENALFEKAKNLALTLKNKAKDDKILQREKREEYYGIFQKYCQGATSAAIIGEIICNKLKEPIQQSVYKNTARDLADEMKTNCESLNGNRSNLEKHILKRLAEKEDFEAYKTYIHNPKEHFRSFIRDEVSQYIKDKFNISVLPKMKDDLNQKENQIKEAVKKATKDVAENSGDTDLWLKIFTLNLSDVLIFSEKDLEGVSRDDVDVKLLAEVIRKELPTIISNVRKEFSTASFLRKLEYKDRTDEILNEHFCQCCWAQCPFCRAICTHTAEDHDPQPHSVPFHRPDGLNGCHYRGTQTLTPDFCTTLVASTKRFYRSHESDETIPYKDYKSAGGVYAEWSITPDLTELSYWKWFVCRFQKELENYYEKKFQDEGEIPDEWRIHSKEDAIESLDKYF
ncbi:Interferon-induced very large GTPase 1 [Labeo rohita]|uniref:Interferon-induced very large GTPase 1 n=1 Tax=Labeo rohita TaxID=84645 RepID=A0ABQ8MZ50_LABRO|nr:Interferon-induced very large GTPase 1 [Labeo rohita]